MHQQAFRCRSPLGLMWEFDAPSHSRATVMGRGRGVGNELRNVGEWRQRHSPMLWRSFISPTSSFPSDRLFRSLWQSSFSFIADSSCTLSSNLFVRVFAQDPFKGFRHRTPRQGDQQDGALQLADGGFQLQDKAVIVNRCPCPWGQISNRYPCYCMPSARFGPCPCDSSLDYSIKKWDTHSLRFSRNWTVSLLETLVFLKCNRTATFKWYKIIVLWVWINSY